MTYQVDYGSHYEETKQIPVKEIAAMIRAEIKAMVAAGDLPADWKYSVRLRRASMMVAIDIEIRIPDAIRDLIREFEAETGDYWRRDSDRFVDRYGTLRVLQDTRDKIEALHAKYNYYGRDFYGDGCDVRYFGNITFGSLDRPGYGFYI